MTSDNVSLFKEKHKFMHTAFDKKLQTDREKKHAREHEGYCNAQSACQKLNLFCTKSTNARASAFTALSYVTSAKIES